MLPAYQAAIPPIRPPPPARYQKMRQLRRVLLQFAADRALARQHIRVVIGMHFQRSGLGLPGAACGQRLGIGLAVLNDPGAVALDTRHLGGRRQRRHENLRRDAECARRVGDRRAVIATRRGDHPAGRARRDQQPVERSAGLETSGVLQQFEFQGDRAGHSQLLLAKPEKRCVPDIP